jgi:hypothetical protein
MAGAPALAIKELRESAVKLLEGVRSDRTVGSSVYDHLRGVLGAAAVPMNSAEATPAKDRSGQLGSVNRRAEWWWRLREALDPATGDSLALPPDPSLLADLCAPQWKLAARGIQIEAKEDIIRRIGRSPDKGDSAVYCWGIRTTPGKGLLEFYRMEAARMASRDRGP